MHMLITGKTKVVGVAGWPIKHTLSPQMHNAAFQALGLDFVYVPFGIPPESLGGAVGALGDLGIVGMNFTIPHKLAVMELVDELSPEAEAIGAVNTIAAREGKLFGDNTDGRGFVMSLKEELDMDAAGKSFVVLGGGGAARGVAMGLGFAGAKSVVVANRTESKAVKIADDLAKVRECHVAVIGNDGEGLRRAVEEAEVLVNTTSLGLHDGDPMPIAPELLHEGLSVCDIVYNPPVTPLLKAASERGLANANGLGMLVHQGAIAFELWTGVYPPADVMRKAITED
ncbi:shikimate dehydrogenase [Candidatus Hydrogenedentota bacterium]